MPRRPRQASTSGFYHFMAKGVNKKKLFHRDNDYRHYLKLLLEYSHKLGVEIYHYCLMPNHTHLVLKAEDVGILSQFGHFTHRRYAYYYCGTYHWSGQVFRRNFTSLPIINDGHLLELGRYIERNPVKVKLVDSPEKYLYSSYPFYALAMQDALLTKSPMYGSLGNNENECMAAYRFYVNHERRQEVENLTIPF